MQIHICDTSDLQGHVNCGGFLWPDTVKVFCGKDLPFTLMRVERICSDDKRICEECLRRYMTNPEEGRKNIVTIAE